MSYRPQVKADSNGTTQDLPIDAETVQGKTPVFTTTNQTISGVKTYTDIQTFKGGITLYAESGDSPRLTFQRSKLTDTYNDWSLYGSGRNLYLQQRGLGSTAWEIRATFTQSDVDFAGTIKENGTSLVDKYAPISHNHDESYLPLSGGTLTGNLTGKYITGTWLQTTAAGKASVNTGKVCVLDSSGWIYYRTPADIVSDGGGATKATALIDYGDTTNTIKIGYRGNGLTASQIGYIAGYSNVTDPNNPNEHKIKDISKDVLKSWLGYAEVTTGVWSPGTTLSATSGYVWIVYPYDSSANTFTFTYGSGDRTGYGFAIVQGGGCIRYFQSATQLTRYSISTITFSTKMVYIKFKI